MHIRKLSISLLHSKLDTAHSLNYDDKWLSLPKSFHLLLHMNVLINGEVQGGGGGGGGGGRRVVPGHVISTLNSCFMHI